LLCAGHDRTTCPIHFGRAVGIIANNLICSLLIGLLGCCPLGQTDQTQQILPVPVSGWSNPTTEICGDVGIIHGQFGNNVGVSRTYDFGYAVEGTVVIELMFYALGSWNDEYGYIYVDVQLVWSVQWDFHNNCFATLPEEGTWCPSLQYDRACRGQVHIEVEHSGQTLELEIKGNFDSGPSNEVIGFAMFLSAEQ
jgi:hypothetical protein